MPREEGSKARRLVTCAECGWRGRRIEEGGQCGRTYKADDDIDGEVSQCAGTVAFGVAHAPKAPVGETRVRMTVRVLERTAAAITPTAAAILLDAEAARVEEATT